MKAVAPDTVRSGVFLAGAATSTIDVPTGVPIGGWGARKDHGSVGTHRDLVVSVLVVSEAAGEPDAGAVLVAADVVLWPAAVGARVRAAVGAALDVPPEAVILTATHTHSSLMLDDAYLAAWDPEGTARALRERFEALIPDVAQRAAAARQPATLTATRRASRVARSRRQVAFGRRLVGVADPVEDAALEVVEIDAEDGSTIASLVAYGCHPTTLSWASLQASPDFVGALREVVESATRAPCLFLQGCGADRAPVYGFSNSTRDADAVGYALGHVALGALLEERQASLEVEATAVLESGTSLCLTRTVTAQAAPARLAVRAETLDLPLRPRDLAATRERLEAARARREAGDHDAVSEFAKALIEEDICLRYPDGDTGPVDVVALQIGPLCILGWPLELSGAYDALMRGDGETHVVVATSVNDYVNYLPAHEQFPEGGYEVLASPFASRAADVVVAAAQRLAAPTD